MPSMQIKLQLQGTLIFSRAMHEAVYVTFPINLGFWETAHLPLP